MLPILLERPFERTPIGAVRRPFVDDHRTDFTLVQLQFGQAYPWRDGDELTLIDAGVPGSGPDMAGATRQLGLAPEVIRRIVLTHGHEDHYGAAAEVRSWAGATVHAQQPTRPFSVVRQHAQNPC